MLWRKLPGIRAIDRQTAVAENANCVTCAGKCAILTVTRWPRIELLTGASGLFGVMAALVAPGLDPAAIRAFPTAFSGKGVDDSRIKSGTGMTAAIKKWAGAKAARR